MISRLTLALLTVVLPASLPGIVSGCLKPHPLTPQHSASS